MLIFQALYWKSVNCGKISGTGPSSPVPISVGQICPEGILPVSTGSSADVTNCDLRGAVTGDLDIRRTNLEGVKIDYEQASSLMADLGITVTE